MFSQALLVTISGVVFALLAAFALTSRSAQYPPGPPSWPLFGVALNHPKTEFWKTYAEWGRKYAADAFNLLSKRSANYSDRPYRTMASRLMRREKSIFVASYNDLLKTYRRLMHQSFNPTASQMYWELEEEEARVLVDNVLSSPQNLVQHLRRNAAAVIMKIAYGYPVTCNDDHFVKIAEEGIKIISMAGAPGKWLVDSFPVLRFLPEWFPGAGFKRQAKEWSQTLYSQSLEPHMWVKEQIRAGTAIPSFTSTLLQPADGHTVDADEEDKIIWTSGALYLAGADTSVSVMETFFFTMMMHPLVQHKAQDEVDRFLSAEKRLPTLRDQAMFPYVGCVLKEILRWAPPAPFGLFHCTTKADVYKGFLIPAKTSVMANIWAIMHDETTYPNPFMFDPTRFLGDNPEPDPRDYAFGFGRRICPGQHLAEHSIWIQMVLSLLTMNISKAVDADGRVVEPEVAFTSGAVSHVKPFKCQIDPRPGISLSLVRVALQNS
ncbi:cytochrome P450 [Mycena pura]|uniref:Cytochrome P450 n=1 Tax=Mycena pura TaxID=153505 RepID=A0AAD6YTQ3_9AGAR|nr:cytochrome P450 [Mycena pura]